MHFRETAETSNAIYYEATAEFDGLFGPLVLFQRPINLPTSPIDPSASSHPQSEILITFFRVLNSLKNS